MCEGHKAWGRTVRVITQHRECVGGCECACVSVHACEYVRLGFGAFKLMWPRSQRQKKILTAHDYRIVSTYTVALVLSLPLQLVVWAPGPNGISSTEREP